jgi:hypothetical protein
MSARMGRFLRTYGTARDAAVGIGILERIIPMDADYQAYPNFGALLGDRNWPHMARHFREQSSQDASTQTAVATWPNT